MSPSLRFVRRILFIALFGLACGDVGFLADRLTSPMRLYIEAEPLLPAAAEFGHALADRLKGDRREVRWADLTELLAEERFAALRDRGFVPSDRSDVMITLRANDGYEFALMAGGGADFVFRD